MDIKLSIKIAAKDLGIDRLRKHQIQPIHSILSGNDTVVLAPTSAGKSAMYWIPAILHPQQLTIVIEPTLALMHDQTQKLKNLGIAAAYVDSTIPSGKRETILKQALAGKLQFLYIIAERFTSTEFSSTLHKLDLFMVVIDEVHCVLDWGHSFRDAYLHIGEEISRLTDRPVVAAFTATATQEDIEESYTLLHMNQPNVFVNSLYRENLIYVKKFADSRKQKQKLLQKYLSKYHKHSSIVYCNTRKAVDAVYTLLEKKYPDQVIKCHANLPDKARTQAEWKFLSGEKTIMVATTAFGMGIDLRTLDLVIHFNMPLSLTDYMQQSGRAGRDGQKAHCILLYSDEDYYTNQLILVGEIRKEPQTEAEKRILSRLDNMRKYCYDDKHCMVQLLLAACGQQRQETCNRCTNCQTKRRKTQ